MLIQLQSRRKCPDSRKFPVFSLFNRETQERRVCGRLPAPPSLNILIYRYFSEYGWRRFGATHGGFPADQARRQRPVRRVSPICGALSSQLSHFTFRVVRFASRRDAHVALERAVDQPFCVKDRRQCVESDRDKLNRSLVRCSCQSIGARVSANSLDAVRSAGCRTRRIARVMPGARKLTRSIQVK